MQTKCHLSQLPYAQAKKYGDRTVFVYREFGSETWKEISWKGFAEKVKRVSNALLSLGVRIQENIGVFSQNSVQYIYTDFGAFGIRAVTIPFYATSSEEQIQYIINDASIRILFVGEQEQYDKARRVQALCPSLERIVIFDDSVIMADHDATSIFFKDLLKMADGYPNQIEVETLWKQANEEDLANILYTSGTSGDSKGVMLTYYQYHAAIEANDKCVPVCETDRVITFLPITHIFERGWDFLSLSEGATLIINTNPREIQKSMRETHPTCMSAVPRFWEKVYTGVQEKIDNVSPFKQKIFRGALEIGCRHNIDYLAKGKRPPLSLALKYKIANKTILSLVRKELGIDKHNIFPTAGATVSPEVEIFVHSIGVKMIVGYGLTESLATVSCDHRDEPFSIGSIGRPIEGIDIKIGENNEILLKGPTITKGYYKRDHLNKEAFTEDGYFRTGDAGYLKNGELYITERIKDLFKTSNGKYIAPQAIEAKLLVDKFVEQIVIIADQRKFVSALIVPAYPLLEEYARENGIAYKGREDLCSNVMIIKMLTERIATLQQGLAGYEQVKRFTLLTKPFTMESGELTNTLKTRRSVICKNYAVVIEEMYKE
ncbi:MAG: long-chain fatty acid--CoA ligase [Prevotellaceae bacterium]|nr:long-chain fatty acid--CoA ligase [Prevotellaceae bacterium]